MATKTKKAKKPAKKTARKAAKPAKKAAPSGLFTPNSAAHLAKILKNFDRRLKNLEIINGTDTPPPTGTIDFP